ncbi:MAG TPA: deoxyribodipyrimidine photo-lyase [Verrucomicrobiae bacterium]
MKRVIHWFRRDLRLHDNTALSDACRRAEQVVPVFIFEDAFRTGPDIGAARLLFLLRSLAELNESLRHIGSQLVIRFGKSELEIPKLARELQAEAVFCNARYEPYAQQRDARVFNALNEWGIGFESFKDAVAWHEQEILTQAGKPFTVFTPYARAWKARKVPLPRPGPDRTKLSVRDPIRSDELPADSAAFGFPCSQHIFAAGERAALKQLDDFLRAGIFDYATARDRADLVGTSQLSAHLRTGTLGIRTVIARLSAARSQAAAAAQKSFDVFLNELIWREFYLQVLHNHPHVMRGAFRREYDALEWSDNEQHFRAWCEGQTGYPIIDAAMRCLNATGWMHNRLRMIVAMFLTKDLLINWQRGERYFMQQLVDGDMAANNGGWQWSAGTGTDAAPYFRIFNPTTQAAKCDPSGAFVRRWIPELASVPGDFIHEPWNEPLRAPKYPSRIVLHEEQRAKALAMFAKVKG